MVEFRPTGYGTLAHEEIYGAEDSRVLMSGTAKQVVFDLPQAEWIRPVVVGNSWTGNVGIEELRALSRF